MREALKQPQFKKKAGRTQKHKTKRREELDDLREKWEKADENEKFLYLQMSKADQHRALYLAKL